MQFFFLRRVKTNVLFDVYCKYSTGRYIFDISSYRPTQINEKFKWCFSWHGLSYKIISFFSRRSRRRGFFLFSKQACRILVYSWSIVYWFPSCKFLGWSKSHTIEQGVVMMCLIKIRSRHAKKQTPSIAKEGFIVIRTWDTLELC